MLDIIFAAKPRVAERNANKMNHQLFIRRCLLLTGLLTAVFILPNVVNWLTLITCPYPRTESTYCRTSEHYTDRYDDISRMRPVYPVQELGFYFYAAYYDDRQKTAQIRILGVFTNDSRLDGFTCRWNSTKGISNEVNASCQAIDRNWPLYNLYLAFMMTCPLGDVTPLEVVVSRGHRDVILPVRLPRSSSSRDPLAVCVKPVTSQISVPRLVEWFELHLAAGYGNFLLYDSDVQGGARYVLEYYRKRKSLSILPFPFLTSVLALAERRRSIGDHLRYALYQQVYLVALQDCILRYHRRYKYLAMVDLDEAILPAKNVTIDDVIASAEQNVPDVGSYVFYTYWHFREFSPASPEIPEVLYAQQAASAPRPSLDQPKSFVSTSGTLTVNWHGVISTLESVATPRYLLSHADYAAVHHFRSGRCEEHFHDLCADMTSSSRPRPEVLRYRNVTETNVRKVLDYLQL